MYIQILNTLPTGAKATVMQWRSDAFVLTGRRLLNAAQSQGVALGYNLLGLQPVGISSHPAFGSFIEAHVLCNTFALQ